MSSSPPTPRRRVCLVAAAGFLAGCGGGDSASGSGVAGTVKLSSLQSRSNGTKYSLSVYLPPGMTARSAAVPVIYLLDGDSRFATVVSILEQAQAKAMVVGIGNEDLRARDYAPSIACTGGAGGGSGAGAYLDFIRFDLIPFIEATFGGDPDRRILLGHSLGGCFVFYALFVEPPATRHFAAYLPSDAPIECISAMLYGWEEAYAAANTAFNVRLHISYAAYTSSATFAQQLQSRNYTGLALASKYYDGGHLGMIPGAFKDAVAFALA